MVIKKQRILICRGMMTKVNQLKKIKELTYEEERELAVKMASNSEKPKLSRMMIIGVILLEFSAIGGMGYLVYHLYF